MYQFTGRVSEVCAVQTFASGFSKRELIVREEEGKWPRAIPFNFKKENIAKLDGISPGDRVTVHFALDGREWTDERTKKVRHFCDLVGLSVDVLSGARPVCAQAAPSEEAEESDMPL